MKLKLKRFSTLFAILCCMGGTFILIGLAFKNNIRFFVTPAQVYEENLIHHTHLRIGGVVQEKSLLHKGINHTFYLIDGIMSIPVKYTGILPALFKEGQTVVVEGHFDPEKGTEFMAHTILAKHDENYKPLLKKAPS